MITVILMIAVLLTYFLVPPLGGALWPLDSAQFRWWQLITYAFQHSGALHLILNVLALLSFGPTLEREWGRWRFLCCYVTAAVLGGLMQAGLTKVPMVGASAALFGLFAAYAFEKRDAKLVTIFIWPMPAMMVLLLYILLTLIALLCNLAPGVAHLAHMVGVIVGINFATFPKRKPRP